MTEPGETLTGEEVGELQLTLEQGEERILFPKLKLRGVQSECEWGLDK